MSIGSIFAHADVAPLRAVLEQSATARASLARFDELPVKLHIVEPPADGTPLMEALEYGTTASYHPATNQMTVARTLFSPDDLHVKASIGSSGETADVTLQGTDPREAAATVFHEMKHREQAGKFPILSGYGDMMAMPYRGAFHGVRELVHGPRDGRTGLQRFLDGADFAKMRPEVDAYRAEGAVKRELGLEIDPTDIRYSATATDMEISRAVAGSDTYKGQKLLGRGLMLGVPVVQGAVAASILTEVNDTPS